MQHPTCSVADLGWSRYWMTRRGHAIHHNSRIPHGSAQTMWTMTLVHLASKYAQACKSSVQPGSRKPHSIQHTSSPPAMPSAAVQAEGAALLHPPHCNAKQLFRKQQTTNATMSVCPAGKHSHHGTSQQTHATGSAACQPSPTKAAVPLQEMRITSNLHEVSLCSKCIRFAVAMAAERGPGCSRMHAPSSSSGRWA